MTFSCIFVHDSVEIKTVGICVSIPVVIGFKYKNVSTSAFSCITIKHSLTCLRICYPPRTSWARTTSTFNGRRCTGQGVALYHGKCSHLNRMNKKFSCIETGFIHHDIKRYKYAKPRNLGQCSRAGTEDFAFNIFRRMLWSSSSTDCRPPTQRSSGIMWYVLNFAWKDSTWLKWENAFELWRRWMRHAN